jgi:hypothetical protein
MRFPREACVSRNAVLGTRSRPAGVIARSLIDLGRRHVPRDVSHLLADIVLPGASREGLELGLDVDGGLPVEPGRTELGDARAVAGSAGRNVVGSITLCRQQFSACKDCIAGDGRRRRRKWRLLGCEIVAIALRYRSGRNSRR